ncbi:uncharacterized protein LOC144422066 [Styela clava]
MNVHCYLLLLFGWASIIGGTVTISVNIKLEQGSENSDESYDEEIQIHGDNLDDLRRKMEERISLLLERFPGNQVSITTTFYSDDDITTSVIKSEQEENSKVIAAWEDLPHPQTTYKPKKKISKSYPDDQYNFFCCHPHTEKNYTILVSSSESAFNRTQASAKCKNISQELGIISDNKLYNALKNTTRQLITKQKGWINMWTGMEFSPIKDKITCPVPSKFEKWRPNNRWNGMEYINLTAIYLHIIDTDDGMVNAEPSKLLYSVFCQPR